MLRRISFGKDKDFWTNVYPTALVAQFQSDIKKFGTALSVIKKFEPVFAMIPVHTMLKMFNFSKDFGDKMVYPLVALFFGTGNQTPYISSAILVSSITQICGRANSCVGTSLQRPQHAPLRVLGEEPACQHSDDASIPQSESDVRDIVLQYAQIYP